MATEDAEGDVLWEGILKKPGVVVLVFEGAWKELGGAKPVGVVVVAILLPETLFV